MKGLVAAWVALTVLGGVLGGMMLRAADQPVCDVWSVEPDMPPPAGC